ncbi:transcription factor jumonji [Tieghemostelium lacteum]|uniref:Transcription factor jumonji n=1 Tax=Tieghemostelium lacteum TaxID=361077 RepID=A0A151ZEG6_TIELA|nr:transcription factor jumonji [Tieghemostelium lacteum]|eukprot:KYQ92309.1 transcription factor jumonji [Tieghemostelium lacteum]
MVQEILDIKHVNDKIGKEEFYGYIKKNEPVVFTSMAKEWPAVKKWSADFLIEQVGDKLVDVDMCKFGKFSEIQKMKFSEYCSKARDDSWSEEYSQKNRAEKPYLRNFPIDEYPQLKDDVMNESYFNQSIHNLIIRGIFLGSKDSVTHLHKDTGDNLVAVVKGKKFFILIPPNQESLVSYDKDLEIAYGPSDKKGIQIKDHPSFSKVQKLYTVIVDEGESIFIPIGWLHYVHNLDFSVSCSCWGKEALI